MNDTFDIDRDVPEKMWAVLRRSAGDSEKLRAQLESVSREEFVAIFRAFLEAKTEMVDRLGTFGYVADASEDTLDELADSLLTLGKDVFKGVFEGETPLPPRRDWHRLPGLSSVFGDVFDERFGADIYEDLELT